MNINIKITNALIIQFPVCACFYSIPVVQKKKTECHKAYLDEGGSNIPTVWVIISAVTMTDAAYSKRKLLQES